MYNYVHTKVGIEGKCFRLLRLWAGDFQLGEGCEGAEEKNWPLEASRFETSQIGAN